jgi:hypothetical protein
MAKNTYIIGDIHGAGQELQGLLDVIAPSADDEIVAVGDEFDRGQHADLVWKLLLGRKVFMGNHEYKILQWLRGEFDFLPHYYYYALNRIIESGVAPAAFFAWLESLPMLEDRGSYMITHGGVVLDNPTLPNLSMNVYYADGRNYVEADCGWVYQKGVKQTLTHPEWEKMYWWDIYKGDKLVVYGHLVAQDNLPRIRKNDKGQVNSIGLDTAAVHGGPLTAYCPQTDRFYSYRSGVDWYTPLVKSLKAAPPLVNQDLMAFVREQRAKRKESQDMVESAKA